MTLFRNHYRVETTRLREWDYAAAGWYFVTICTWKMTCFFGEVERGEMGLSAIGEIADAYWKEIPHHFVNACLDIHVIMPNHVHGIIGIITDPDRNDSLDSRPCRDVARNVSTDALKNTTMSEISPKAGSLGVMMRSYKAAVTRWSRNNGHDDFGWQARFYDHIIRSERAFEAIRTYIINNPLKWELDRNYPKHFNHP